MSLTQRDYKATLNLPRTDFPMKADLAKREPDRVRWWAQQRTYQRRLESNEGSAPWILHDGPPYANGELHMGTFLNRVLKDTFVKIHLLDGRWAKFVPGWDMHGLPIERETLIHLGLDFHHVDPVELRAACRERALHWLDLQRETMLRLGSFGEFDRPYRTIDPSFEATIVEALAELAERNQLYKGLRSTLWCIRDETALADAEIEYRERESPSIYVRFPATSEQRRDVLERFGADSELGGALSILIWTTTPWTLPANAAIALKPDASYGLYRNGEELLVVAEALAASVAAKGGARFEPLGTARGETLVGASVRHPFAERDSLVVSADYVELETGTGAVHTAPGHGVDDFDTGVRFGLPILVPVDDRGHFTKDAGPYAGRQVFEANAVIIDDLRASGALYASETYRHSYPHCWRCKQPVIFRATSQWFIAMDVNRLRKHIVEKIPGVRWTPAWGESRMTQMIENHPEWCISRQRTWGTPIPAVLCRGCGDSILDPAVARLVAQRFRQDGADVWYTDDVATFLPPGFECPHCQGTEFAKEFNIVDIWFESGVTNLAVLGHRGLPWPADLFLEGSDQYRGWFRSNLVTAVATKGAPPYKHVVSTGWVVDAEGRAMHKSAGNYMAANEAIARYGADVLRLWVASVEFTADVRLGESLLDNVSRVYRNLRNRLRFLLGVVDDLEPGAILGAEALEPLDRLAVAACDAMAQRVGRAYRNFSLHEAYLALIAFDVDDLSRFYLDALKDRLYSSARGAARRRSAQSAVWHILKTLVVLLAPVLSFTAEEAWQCVPARLRGEAHSAFDLELPKAHEVPAALLDEWNEIKTLRAAVAANEDVRDFELRATIVANAETAGRLEALGDNLREALIVSALDFRIDDGAQTPSVETAKADGEKCQRCWKYLPLGSDARYADLCAECTRIVEELEAA